jgi:hypothetical protein
MVPYCALLNAAITRIWYMMQDANISYRKIQGLSGEASFSLTLPKTFAQNLGISKGSFVRVAQEGQRIVVERAEGQ